MTTFEELQGNTNFVKSSQPFQGTVSKFLPPPSLWCGLNPIGSIIVIWFSAPSEPSIKNPRSSPRDIAVSPGTSPQGAVKHQGADALEFVLALDPFSSFVYSHNTTILGLILQEGSVGYHREIQRFQDSGLGVEC